jgi:hypothetical protein
MIDTVRPQVDQFANAHTWLVWAALISLFAYGFCIESTRWIRELRRDVRRGLALGGRAALGRTGGNATAKLGWSMRSPISWRKSWTRRTRLVSL